LFALYPGGNSLIGENEGITHCRQITEEGEMYKRQMQRIEDNLSSEKKCNTCDSSKSLEADLRYMIETQRKMILHLEEKLGMP
jgi:hypothetical protein